MAKEELGLKISLEAEASNLQSELRKLQSNLTSIDKQGRNLKTALKFDPSNAETYNKVIQNLESRQKELSSTISTAKSRLDVLNRAYDEAKSTTSGLNSGYKSLDTSLQQLKDLYGENSDEVKQYKAAQKELEPQMDAAKSNESKLANAIESTKKKLNESEAEYTKTTAEIKKYKSGTDDAGQSTEQIAQKIDDLSDRANTMNLAMANLVADGIRKAIQGFKKLASEVLEAGSSFEDGINGLAAILQESKDSYVVQDLADYFEELGTQSKYSAAEIANNAQVLANAGYSSQEIKDSIKTIGDLAAGTGESFEEMSSIVVDGLAAFGMKSNEAAHFADVLAKAAISSNTNVSMMGEAFKYVGAVAGTLGYSVEDVGVALGAMANQGVKASTAGTTLRSIFSRLATNTSGARDALHELGIEFFDADGKARDLVGSLGPDGVAGTADDTTGVLDELRDAMAGMNDEQKTSLEYTIAGQRGLAGLAAVVNTSSDKWNELKKEVNDYNGTVDQMAKTRLDSYSGDVALLKNNWEETATAMYKEVEPSLRKVVNSLTKLMQTDFFKKDVRKVADDFASGLENVSKIIDGINPKTIAMAKSIAEMALMFTGTTKAVTLAGNAISNVTSTISGLRSVSAGLGSILTGTNANLSGLSGVLTLLGGNLPVVAAGAGLLVTAFGGLAVATKAQWDAEQQEIESMYGLSEATQDTIDKMDGLATSYQTLKESTAQQATDVLAQSGYYEQLATEYDSIIAKQDQMTDQDRERADTILTILAEAFGVEKTQIQDLINENGSLSAAIQDTIEKKKADALLSVYQEQYATAIQTVTEAQQAQNEILEERNKHQEEVNDLEARQKELVDELTKTTDFSSDAYRNNSSELEEVTRKLITAKQAVGEADDKLKTNQETIEDCQTTITNYEALVGAAASGSADAIEQATGRINTSFKTADNTSYQSLISQEANMYDLWQAAKKEYESGSSSVTKTQVDMYKSLYDQSVAESRKAKKEYTGYGKSMGEGAEEGLNSSKMDFYRANGNFVKNGGSGFTNAAGIHSPSTVWRGYGINLAQGAINGINAMQWDVYRAAANLAEVANNAYKKTLKIHSPSRVMMENGKFTGEGLIAGMDKQIPEIARKGQEMAETLNDSIQGYIQGGSLNNITNQSYDNSTYSPNVSIQIVQREGEDPYALAKRVSELINDDVKRGRTVWQ